MCHSGHCLNHFKLHSKPSPDRLSVLSRSIGSSTSGKLASHQQWSRHMLQHYQQLHFKYTKHQGKRKRQNLNCFVKPSRAFLAFRQSHTDCTIFSMTIVTIIMTHSTDFLTTSNLIQNGDSRPQISKPVSDRLQRHSKVNCCSA